MPKDSKRKATAKDVPGIGKRGGSARDAGRKVEKRKASNRDALAAARAILMQRQATDKHQ